MLSAFDRIFLLFGVLAPALKCNCGFSLIFLTLGLGLGLEKFIQHRLRWFGHVQRRPPEAPVHSGILKHDGNEERQGPAEVDMGRNN